MRIFAVLKNPNRYKYTQENHRHYICRFYWKTCIPFTFYKVVIYASSIKGPIGICSFFPIFFITKQKNENITLIVNRNNLDKAVYVGDIQGDYDATMKAGLPFIHAKYGCGKINTEVPVINSLDELPEIIETII